LECRPGLNAWIYWRSLGKWFSRVITTSWVHKHSYLRSLNLKALSLQLQTLPNLLTVGAAVVFAASQPSGKSPCSARPRAQSVCHRQLDDSLLACTKRRSALQPADQLRLDRSVVPLPLPRPSNQLSATIDDCATRARSRSSGRARRVTHHSRNVGGPRYASNSAPEHGNRCISPWPWAPSPRRSNPILHDHRSRGASPRRHPYGPQMDRGRRTRRPPNRRCCPGRRARSLRVSSPTSRRLIAYLSPELSSVVNYLSYIGKTTSTYIAASVS